MLHHIFTKDVEWYKVKVKSYPGMKAHNVFMHSRKTSLHVCQKPHYHALLLVSAINFVQVIPVMLHAVFILNLFSLALSLKSRIPYLLLSTVKISDEGKIFENGFVQPPNLPTSQIQILPWAEREGSSFPVEQSSKVQPLRRDGIKTKIFCVSRKVVTGLHWLLPFHRRHIGANIKHTFFAFQLKNEWNKLVHKYCGRVVKIYLSSAQLQTWEITFDLQKIHHIMKNIFVVYYWMP